MARLLGGVLSAVLVATTVSPSWAQGERGGEQVTPVVGDFALGDGIEGAIDPRDGSFGFTMRVGGLVVRWDSRAAGADPHGLGGGLSWDLGRIDTVGGVHVRPSSSNEALAADASQPSGLAGYGVRDVVFEQVGGVLPPRSADERRPGASEPGVAVAFAYVLHELGGMDTYFDAQGQPVARLDVFGVREEWRWDELVPHRLVEHVDVDGVVTELDWTSEPGELTIRPAANLVAPPAGEDDLDAGARDAVWRVEFDGGRVTGILDPLGGRTWLEHDESTGVVAAAGGPTGGVTRVAWHLGADAVPRVERVVTADASGAELSAREWRSVGQTLPSGWPLYAGEREVFRSGDPAFRTRTAMTDGATRVVSEYNALHTLVARRMVVTTASGDQEVQEQTLTYPGTEAGGVPDPASLPPNWSRPTLAEVTVRDQYGGSRTTTEATEFDEVGRLISRTDPDGTVTLTEYDQVVPDGRRLPIGLAVTETVRAPDGEARVTMHSLDAGRRAILATEVSSVPANVLAAPLVVARSEFEVGSDGRVTEQRVFPGGDGEAEPNVTRSNEIVDLAAGTRTVTETIGVGTNAEATSAEVTSLITGQVLAVVDPLGNTGRVRHDRLGRAALATDASGRVTTVTYETAQENGRNATVVRTPDGVERTEIRDELGRVIRSTDNVDRGRVADGHVRVVEIREYPEPGVTSVTDAWGAITTTREDVFGRVIEAVAPTGLVQLTRYDDVANTVTTALTPTGFLSDAEFVSTERMDEAGRPVEASGRRADGESVFTTRSSYDGFGRPRRIENDSVAQTHEYDGYGQAVRTERAPIDPDARSRQPVTPSERGAPIVADRRFNEYGNGVEKILSDATSSRSGGSRTLDALGRTIETTDQVGGVTTFEHTIDGLVSSATTSAGQVTTARYDDVRRVLLGTAVESPVGAAVSLEYELDSVTDAVLAVFDPEDREGTIITYESDAWGNPTTVTYPDGRRVRVQYDEHGRRTGGVDVAGNVTELDSAPDGRLRRAVQRDRAGAVLAEMAYEYDVFARVEAIERGNGVRTEFSFTSASEIASERTMLHGVEQTHRAYTYDAEGHLVRRIDTDLTGDRAVSVATVYGYDAHGRLVRSAEHAGADEDAPVTMRTTYELSASNDVRAETVVTDPGTPGETATRREFEYAPVGELIAMTTVTSRGSADEAGSAGEPGAAADEVRRDTQHYDEAGNLLIAADGTAYTYDAANRPVTETRADGVTVAIGYWVDGTLRSRTRAGGPLDRTAATTFYWDGDTLLNDVHSGAEAGTGNHLIGSARHARTVTGSGGDRTTTYFVTDRHGSVTELTDVDGRTRERYRYSDYGVPTREHVWEGAYANPFGYAGEQTHDSGRQHLATRTYDPRTMRFTTLDTAELHNLYAYADGNPITRIDPSGRTGIEDLGHWVLALFGIGVGVVSAASMVMTGGATMAALAFVAATVFDALVTVANTVNEQHVEFMPTTVGFVLGFAATAAALLTANWATGGARVTGVKRGADIEMRNLTDLVQEEMRRGEPNNARALRAMKTYYERHRQHSAIIKDLSINRIARADHAHALDEYVIQHQVFFDLHAWAGIMRKWCEASRAEFLLAQEIHHYRVTYMLGVSKRGLWRSLTLTGTWSNGQRRPGLPREVVEIIRERVFTTRSGRWLDDEHLGALDNVDLARKRILQAFEHVGNGPSELEAVETGLTYRQELRDIEVQLRALQYLRYD